MVPSNKKRIENKYQNEVREKKDKYLRWEKRKMFGGKHNKQQQEEKRKRKKKKKEKEKRRKERSSKLNQPKNFFAPSFSLRERFNETSPACNSFPPQLSFFLRLFFYVRIAKINCNL